MTAERDSAGDSPYTTRRKMIGGTAAGVAAMMAGCSQSGNNTTTTSGGGGQETTESPYTDNALEVLHAWTGGDGAKAIGKLTSMFQKKYPNRKTNFRPIGGTGNVNLNSVINRRMANNNPPDSFQAWPGENLRQYEGQLANMTMVWKDNGFTESMNQTAAELSKQNGEYRAVPLGSHRMNNLFYNKQVLKDAGVDPASLTSHSKLVDALDKISSNTDAVPMAHAMKAPWTNLQLWVEVFLGSEGMKAYEKWYKGNGDKAAVKRSLQKTKEILNNYINQDAATISFTEANKKIMNGNAGVIHQGNWVYGQYRANKDFNYEKDWAWRAYPGTEDMYTLHIDAFTFPEDTNARAKQKLWGKFLGQKDPQIAFNNRKGSVPLRTDIDQSRLTDFLQLTAKHLANKPKQPPTLAHGLAVAPEKLGKCKAAIGNNFMGPFNVDKTATALMQAVQ